MPSNTVTDPPGGMGLRPPVRMAPDFMSTVSPIQHGDTTIVSYDEVTNYWIFETELYIEYHRRRERQIALTIIWRRLRRLVHPELVHQVRVLHETGVVRAYFRMAVVPVIHHEVALRNMETFVNNRHESTHGGVIEPLSIPVLVRQVASDGPFLNGSRSPRFSQIGSSHGEITEGDDMASVNSYHARIRRTVTYRHRGADRRGGPGVMDANHGPDVIPPFLANDRPLLHPRRFIVRSPIQGALYTADGRNHFEGERPGDITFVDGDGTTIMAHEFGDGWFVLHHDEAKNNKPFVKEPATREYYIGAYRARDASGVMVHYEARQYVIYAPFMNKAEFFLATSEPDEALRKAVGAMRMKMSVDPAGDPIMASTSVAFIHRCHFMNAVSEDNETAQRCRGSGAIGAYEDGRTAVISVLGVDQDFMISRKVLDKPCDMLNDWDIRGDIQVVEAQGVFGDDGGLIYRGQLTQHPRFLYGPRRRTGRFSTHYFELNGPNISGFVQYDNSDASMECGLKRLLGARVGELDLRENSLRLGNAITQELAGRRLTCVSIGARCRDIPDLMWEADVLRVGSKLTANRRYGPAYEPQASLHSFVANCIGELVSHCDRTRLQKFIDGLLSCGRWAYLTLFLGFLTVFRAFMAREACAQIPHVQMKRRQRFVNRHIFATDELMVGRNSVIKVNTKRETAKAGKAPRLTVDYDAGSMYANELPEYVKVCIDGEEVFQIGDYTLVVYIVAKPKSDSLEKAFARLDQYWHSSRVIYGVVYSDDMCVSGLGEAYNVDISSCDSGQDVPAFMSAYGSMRRFHAKHAEGLLDQCMLPMEIRGEDPLNRLKIKFDGPFLGSGTVLTTVLNHYASVMILCAALYKVSEGATLQEGVVQGAQEVGHLVTVEVVEVIDDFQFLKRSVKKVRVLDGCLGRVSYKYVVYTDRACMLRNLGKIWETIQPRHLGIGKPEFDVLTIQERSDRFFSGVIKGWVNEPSCPIIDALRARFSSEVVSGFEVYHDSINHVLRESTDYSGHDVSEGVLTRYRLTQCELDELVTKIRNLRLGHVVVAEALSKIYQKDYGCGQFSFDEKDHRIGRSFEIEARSTWSC
jgi:hypothetical protein